MSHAPQQFIDYARTEGIPVPLHPDIRAAYRRIGQAVPVQRQRLCVVLPPDAASGLCCHCGTPVPPGAGAALHAVAGFEDTALRLPVLHCVRCAGSPACRADEETPGSGHPPGSPAGFCAFTPEGETLGMELLPGLRAAARAARWLLGAAGLYLAANLLLHSQGQMVSDLVGDTGAIAVQDSTSGHGYNAGTIRFLTGSAPADADAAETGTNLVDVTLPNPLFGAPSGFPSVATANAISAATILASGTVGYGRVKANGSGTGSSTTDRRLQITVGTSGADANFNTLALVSGGSLTVTSFTFQHAA